MIAIAIILALLWVRAGVASIPNTSVSQPHGPCQNGPDSRGCWGEFSIDTNYYENGPRTGITREYWFVVENVTMALDVGVSSSTRDMIYAS